MVITQQAARETHTAEMPRDHVASRPLDLVIQRRTCTHCGAYTWFEPEDLTGGWYHCDRCGAMA